MDEDGTLYVASHDGGWVNKFVPKPGADPARLVGQPLVLSEPAATTQFPFGADGVILVETRKGREP